MARGKSNKRGVQYKPFTVRWLGEMYDGIVGYAHEKKISQALAANELVRLGLEKARQSRKAS